MLDNDTIAALATAPGKGAIAMLRLSGERALEIALRVFDPSGKEIEPFRPTLGHIYEEERSKRLDTAVVTYYRRPRSYTGEDLVEISCHGSPVVARRTLELLIAAGARLAAPGEFTMRAFLNGKMDLAQAEAVRDLIESRTLYQARLAAQQLEGSLSKRLQPVKEELINIAVHLESKVEFVEEEIETAEREELIDRIRAMAAELTRIARSFDYGRIVQEGFKLAIVGRPNVGKSSLFNALLYEERAIVTEIPGTTRDLLAESINIGGIPVRFIDTAGIRRTEDPVEKIGIERSYSAIADADLVLLILDRSEPLTEEDRLIAEKLQGARAIAVLNKSDLPERLEPATLNLLANGWKTIAVSAKEKTGIEELRQLILDTVAPQDGLEREDAIVTNLRHKLCISRTVEHLERAARALEEGLSEEFALYDFHKAHQALGEITGETTIDDLLERIFSTFCIGK